MQTYFYSAKQEKMHHNNNIKKCIYIQNDKNKIDGSFDLPQDNEHTFSASYFHEKHIFDGENIE